MSAEILIVDDNADIRNIINELIIDAGYKTRIAANYNQALAGYSNGDPILFLIKRDGNSRFVAFEID